MWYIAALVLLTLVIFILAFEILKKESSNLGGRAGSLRVEYELALQDNTTLKADNAALERVAEDTVALYEITKDMRKTLDENKIFSLFKERIDKYLPTVECRFVKTSVESYGYATVLPLVIQKDTIGYLVAGDIKEKDKDKFYILAQQFLIGIKGVFLFKKIQELSIIDGLTQVFNRRHFLERLREEFLRSKKSGYDFCFLMVDIDHFKDFNDHYGHLVGDAILRQVAEVIKENIRQVDFMGRYGGEELSVVLTETNKEQGSFVAGRIRQIIEKHKFHIYDEYMQVTVSIGISMFPEDAADPAAVMEKADLALYQAKQAGRNMVCLYKTP
ncbi:MAG: GGDEF domain-containing protein [Candidatus Omnitrophica bacterium]|nr:GGDEF domain-containing protein [Candidatus Omnitrophota bacterium]